MRAFKVSVKMDSRSDVSSLRHESFYLDQKRAKLAQEDEMLKYAAVSDWMWIDEFNRYYIDRNDNTCYYASITKIELL